MSTINDVAKRAGVSAVTVSRVINDTGNVSAATREKVERAIEELGYVPSVMARSLRSKRTRTLALIVSDITNPFWTTIARGVEDAAQSSDYSVFLYNTDENPVKQRRCLDVVVAQRVDGVIIAPYDSDAQNLAKLRQRNVPTVVVDRRIEGWDVDSVYGDSVSGAKALVHHLVSLGHRRIAVLAGPAGTSTAEDRVTGYCMALAEAGISIDHRLIRRGEYRIASGEELAGRVLDEGLGPTAVFAANNSLAVGVIQALMHRPEILLLDEPTGGLDPLMQREVLRLIKEARTDGATVFFSSHNITEVEAVADQVNIIREGVVVEVVEVAELLTRALRRALITFREPVDIAALLQLPGVSLLSQDNHTTVELQVTGDMDTLIKALGRYPVVDMQTTRPSLESIFMTYYETEKEEVS